MQEFSDLFELVSDDTIGCAICGDLPGIPHCKCKKCQSVLCRTCAIDHKCQRTVLTLGDKSGNPLIHILEDTLHLSEKQIGKIMEIVEAKENWEDTIEYRFIA
jgi:hypothetical protein